jgi:pimeloyl-ACP methyl ester carboxylesterase
VPSPEVLAILAALAALGVLTVAHVLFWRWKLRAPGGEDVLVRTTTRDGWSLALGRRLPRAHPRRPPVLLVHGIAMNRQAFDFGVERYSLSAFLASEGFDCFALDLRGHGASRKGPSRRWTLDTYLEEDLPAALDAIREATGASEVLYVGHSQGAILGMAACALHRPRIRALVALAGPAHFDAQPRLKKLVALRRLGLAEHLRLVARTAAPFSGYWHPALLELSVNMRNVERPIYRRLLANAIEDLQPGVLDQFAACIRDDTFRSCDGKVDYRALFAGCAQPALFVAGERDGLAPPAVVEAAYRRWGGPKRYWSADGYGHADVILGRRAPEVVFPVVRDFLLEQSERAPRPAEDGAPAPPAPGARGGRGPGSGDR